MLMVPEDPAGAAAAILSAFKGVELATFRRVMMNEKTDWNRHLHRAQTLIRSMGEGTLWKALSDDRKRAIRQRSAALSIDLGNPDSLWNAISEVILPFDTSIWEGWSVKDLMVLIRTSGPVDHFQRLQEKTTDRSVRTGPNTASTKTPQEELDRRAREFEDEHGIGDDE